jgi:hypothetical protein
VAIPPTSTTSSGSGLGNMLGLNDDQMLQLQRAFQAAGSSFAGPAGTNQAGFMRAGPSPQLAQGSPNNLLSTILQMRANQAAALGAPYQAGVMAPQVSLLR